MRRAVGKMIDASATSEEAAKRIFEEIAQAIGWMLAEPQDNETVALDGNRNQESS